MLLSHLHHMLGPSLLEFYGVLQSCCLWEARSSRGGCQAEVCLAVNGLAFLCPGWMALFDAYWFSTVCGAVEELRTYVTVDCHHSGYWYPVSLDLLTEPACLAGMPFFPEAAFNNREVPHPIYKRPRRWQRPLSQLCKLHLELGVRELMGLREDEEEEEEGEIAFERTVDCQTHDLQLQVGKW